MWEKPPYWTKILIRSDLGYPDWGWFCVWVRDYLKIDELGYVVYRPRTAKFYENLDAEAAERAANRWNIANADRPLQIYRVGRHRYVNVDGAFAYWYSVRKALGILDHRHDLNIGLPDPDTMSDEELVAVWGIDFAMDLWRRRRLKAEREDKAFETAVQRMEKRIGRAITKLEREAARPGNKTVA